MDKIVGVITKLDEYIGPNLKKAETAIRAASKMLGDPRLLLDDLNKDKLQLVKDFVDSGANTYIDIECEWLSPADIDEAIRYKESYPKILSHKEKIIEEFLRFSSWRDNPKGI